MDAPLRMLCGDMGWSKPCIGLAFWMRHHASFFGWTSTGPRIVRRIRWLAENLDMVRPVALKGDLTGLYKLRVGDYRIVYEVLHNKEVIVVHLIGHRRDVYRR